MNTANLKTYAPKARRDFIAAVSKQAQKYGVTAEVIHPVQITGDVCVVNGRPFPSKLASRINKLGERVRSLGFEQTMEQTAYSWFNRIIAIRYMELHDYLGHGRRVLSHPEHATGFQILDECTDIIYGQGGQLPHLSQAKVLELKLDGTKDEELYRELLLAQCHALNTAMPFLFETVDDETELLLPENLTKTDSLLHDLVTEIPEDDWDNIEIIGWLYQFYISEKKDQVIGKVVKSEDIPAATQLFTPNWIVKYMVQNSLGAQWLASYPDSPLKAQMEYYIEPAEQTDEVNAQLKAITPDSLNPEELTLIDPASGSGHILVEAYELFKVIYLERGYRQRDVPQLILEKNLFGLDIDERAAQLTGFALMMKGRADDRRLFERGVKLNVMAMVDSVEFDRDAIVYGIDLSQFSLQIEDLIELQDLFKHATTFGSLIQVPEGLASRLPALKQLSDTPNQDLFVSDSLKCLGPLVCQAELLAAQYDAVVANPPYMGGKGMNTQVKKFAKDNFPNTKSDLFAVSTERFLALSRPAGYTGLMTPFTWMFLKSFETLRGIILESKTIKSLIQPEYHAFFESAYVPICTFVTQNIHVSGYEGSFIKLADFYGAELQPLKTLEAIKNPDCDWFYSVAPDLFRKIPGSPLAYWVSERVFEIFDEGRSLDEVAQPRKGLTTADNERFIRSWSEVALDRFVPDCSDSTATKLLTKRWFPLNKGGQYRKWSGNRTDVLNWENDGTELRGFAAATLRNTNFHFRAGITWNDISSGSFAMRYAPQGAISEGKGNMCFSDDQDLLSTLLGFFNSSVAQSFIDFLCPTLNFNVGEVARTPILDELVKQADITVHVHKCVKISDLDWNAYERSWDFQSPPILTATSERAYILEASYSAWITQNRDTIAEMKRLEEENNRLFIDAYGLAEELNPDVPIKQVTLTVNPAYRYGTKNTEEDRDIRFCEDSMQELISYAVGCTMGRYSLDEPGLVYAHSGNEGFDPSRYTTFPADDDGIIPLTDTEWYVDDAANRVVEFISVAWDALHLEANLNFLAANLSPKKSEGSRDTIRRYLCDKFYKDHMQTYKKRPIYWLFSSGKQKAFQCLVYLHRYNEGTLARMRTEYVIPLTAKLSSHIDKLDNDKLASGSAAEIKKLENEIKRLQKQQTELTEFDEKLKHLADQRIKLDLDDGVKVNYGKFGDLLAEVKAIHGK
ncbi:MAG: type II restriction/modification system DNA methylase subunit YeeA [Oleiphilaceae bacterium]|jgi:type II restriction/modification system DNA methylase subunit YeeA